MEDTKSLDPNYIVICSKDASTHVCVDAGKRISSHNPLYGKPVNLDDIGDLDSMKLMILDLKQETAAIKKKTAAFKQELKNETAALKQELKKKTAARKKEIAARKESALNLNPPIRKYKRIIVTFVGEHLNLVKKINSEFYNV